MTGNDVRIKIHGTDKTGRAFASAKRNLTSLNRSAATTARALAGMFGATLGVAAFVRMTRSVIDYGSAITDAAAATNTNIEALQVLNYAAQEAGASQENMRNVLVRVQKSTYDAQRGLSTARDAFRLLNIDVEEFAKLPTERKLETLARKMSEAKDDGKAYGAVLDLLGSRNAPRLNEVLQRLASEGFDEVARSAKAAGQVMREDTAQAMDEMADKLAEFGTYIKTFWSEKIYKAASRLGIVDNLEMELAESEKKLAKFKKMMEQEFTQLPSAIPGQAPMIIPIDHTQTEIEIQRLEANIERIKEEMQSILDERENLENESVIPGSMVEATRQDAAEILKHISGMYNAPNAMPPETYALEQMQRDIEARVKAREAHDKLTLDVMNGNELMLHSMKRASDGMADAFVDFATTGKSSFSEMTSAILADMARMIIQMQVLNPLLNGIFGGAGGAGATAIEGVRAAGGPVSAGTTYLVGEKGPELFTPSRSGAIVPNNQLSAAGPVNISFSVSALDSKDFAAQMAQHRRLMVGVVDEAMNRRGRKGVSQ
jgi:hypothetical protein